MMRYIPVFLIPLLLSCYANLTIEGFDKEKWTSSAPSCDSVRLRLAKTIIESKEELLGEGQAEVKALLGPPDEHELYRRNQKFFYYNLTPGDNTCTFQRLSIRFDALDRVKELMIMEF